MGSLIHTIPLGKVRFILSSGSLGSKVAYYQGDILVEKLNPQPQLISYINLRKQI